MFHATLDSTKTWKQIVDALATLLTEVNFVISETGISLCQLDSSKAAMIDLKLPAGVFQEYTCKGEHVVCLGVDELVKISKRMASDDRLEFSLDEKTQRFEIRMIGQADRKFSLMLLTPPDEERKSKPMPYDVRAEMYANAFKQAVKDIGVVSGHIKIHADKESLTFTGEGGIGEAQVALKIGDESPLYDLQVEKPATAMYSLSYLSEISKAMSSDSLVLQFATDKPIQMEFSVAEGGAIKFILAPRIERRR
ncbi:MAG: proliferating cell nuclear antigen (pcna) [Candidatus Thorarchaeota archaeon]